MRSARTARAALTRARARYRRQVSAAPPTVGVLVDRYGRVARDLRVSLTDKCNLRCTYCMPAEGLPWLAGPQLLTDDEIVRLVRVAVRQLGVTEVRFTGGEPLIRPGLVGIVAAVAALEPRPAHLADHQRHRPGPARRRAARRRAGPGERLAGHAGPRSGSRG